MSAPVSRQVSKLTHQRFAKSSGLKQSNHSTSIQPTVVWLMYLFWMDGGICVVYGAHISDYDVFSMYELCFKESRRFIWNLIINTCP